MSNQYCQTVKKEIFGLKPQTSVIPNIQLLPLQYCMILSVAIRFTFNLMSCVGYGRSVKCKVMSGCTRSRTIFTGPVTVICDQNVRFIKIDIVFMLCQYKIGIVLPCFTNIFGENN